MSGTDELKIDAGEALLLDRQFHELQTYFCQIESSAMRAALLELIRGLADL